MPAGKEVTDLALNMAYQTMSAVTIAANVHGPGFVNLFLLAVAYDLVSRTGDVEHVKQVFANMPDHLDRMVAANTKPERMN